MNSVAIINNSIELSIVDNAISVSVNNKPLTLAISNQGPQGTPGQGLPTGGLTGQALIKRSDTNYDTEWANVGNDIAAIAGATISALKLVYLDAATGKVFYADKDIPATAYSLLGVAIQAANIDDELSVKTAGLLTDSFWSWNLSSDLSLFLGASGTIVQGAPSAEIVAKIGYVVSETSIFIRIADPILTV